jgi:O-antigen/teichoic acid export membrane protein
LTGPASTAVASEGTAATRDDDVAALAKGGRTNVFGFVLRLVARLPFLYLAGRWYGPEALGRFAYAVLVVEFAAQLATLGLKRGLAEQLSRAGACQRTILWDGLFVAALASALASLLLSPG